MGMKLGRRKWGGIHPAGHSSTGPINIIEVKDGKANRLLRFFGVGTVWALYTQGDDSPGFLRVSKLVNKADNDGDIDELYALIKSVKYIRELKGEAVNVE